MIRRLVLRSLRHRPGRSLLLLAGYALGVGVTVALLSIGSALVQQSRDRTLVGGGDLMVLPAGLDLETFRTGGVSSLYFTVEQAPFLYRQVLAGPRFSDRVAAAAPWIDDEVLYLELPGEDVSAETPDEAPAGAARGETAVAGDLLAVSAGGRIPGLARQLGAGEEPVAGSWRDVRADRLWTRPGDSALYAGLDAFHLPPAGAAPDGAWAEWHYFNVLLPEGRGWLYLTYMVAGEVPDGRWGGRMLATLVTRPAADADFRTRQFLRDVPAREVGFSLVRPDLTIGGSSVALGPEGAYRLRAEIPAAGSGADPANAPGEGGGGDADGGRTIGASPLRLDLTVRAPGRSHLPPLDVARGDFASGYVVPMLDARAAGRVCVGDACRELDGAPAYHDHNWGSWSGVAWDWGHARAGPLILLYGGVRREGRGPAGPDGRSEDGRPDAAARRRFLFVTDSLGFAGLLTLDRLEHRWSPTGPDPGPVSGGGPAAAVYGGGPARRPVGLTVRGVRGRDTVRLEATVRHARSTRPDDGRLGQRPLLFWQMRGDARLRGRLLGRSLARDGDGFFETWAPAAAPSGTHLER